MHSIKGLLLISMILLLFCTHYGNIEYVKITNISGSASITRAGEIKMLKTGTPLVKKDVLSVSGQGSIEARIIDSSQIFIGKDSKILFNNYEKKSDKKSICTFTLEHGSIYLAKTNGDSAECIINAGANSVKVKNGDVFISYSDSLHTCLILSINGSAELSADSKSVNLSSCSQITIQGESISQSVPVAESEINEISQWVPPSILDAAIANTECNFKHPVAQKLPPEWNKTPREICSNNQIFYDTVMATCQENDHVTYELAQAPAGMEIDKESGIIKYHPKKAGKYHIVIRARNNDLKSAVYEYDLTVTDGVGVIISAPRIVKLNQKITISANTVNGKSGGDVYYRFDCNGDGVYEFPADGRFGKSNQCNYSYNKEGSFKIHVEIKDGTGATASAIRIVDVKAAPHATLVITPAVNKIGGEFVLDATGSYDSQEPVDSLFVRFDTNGDGLWDLPSGNGYLREKKVVWSWQEPGKHKVKIEIKNSMGLCDSAQAEVSVSQGIVINAITSPDTVHVGDTVHFSCKVNDPEFPVSKYEWNMGKDSIYEIVSLDKNVKYVFQKSGRFSIHCRVIDEKGQSDVQQKEIVVVNSKTIIGAGGVYTARINVPITLKGTARDEDSKIISYAWDLNGDGVIDTTSKNSSSLTYTFTKSGKKLVYFIVTTDDGSKWKDSAIVNVTNKKPVANAGVDIVSEKGRKIKLNGIGTDEDQNIVKYEWDFNGDGTFDWSSNKNGTVSHQFDKYTKAIFKVTDSDGEFATDTMSVIICPEGMRTIKKGKFCIDTYEYPGSKGIVPEVNVTFEDAQKKCSDLGKHLCSAEEWEAACKSEEIDRTYPYGNSFEKDQCNTEGNAFVKNKIASSGEFSKCTGPSNTYDMSGNVAEWVGSKKENPYIYGGSWQSGKNESSCNSKLQLQKGRKYFYVGFRCCK